MTEILQHYVRAVAKNVHVPLSESIDLIIGGGAFNGAYGLGCILVIKELETQKKLRIERVSGCSVGGLLALTFFKDVSTEVEDAFATMRGSLKNDGCMHALRNIIIKVVDKAFPQNDTTMLNGRLFLTHTDLTTMKCAVTSEYPDKNALVEALFRSSFIPLLIDGNVSLEDKYIDGVIPHLFKDSCRDSLYVNLVDYNTMFKAVITRNEANPHYRVMQGAADASHFFVEGNSRMCSWVSNWGLTQYGIQRTMFLVWTMLALLIGYISNIKLPYIITTHPAYRLVITSISELFRDVIYSLSA